MNIFGSAVMDFFENHLVEVFNGLKTRKQKRTYALALRLSIRLDIDGTSRPNPATVLSISREYGFNPKYQKDSFIAINKQKAKKFLTDFGYTINTSFDKTYNRPAYKEVFDREAFTINRRQMLLTYAEWLHFVDYPFEPPLPDVFNEYLDN